jgi:hypothetical protein
MKWYVRSTNTPIHTAVMNGPATGRYSQSRTVHSSCGAGEVSPQVISRHVSGDEECDARAFGPWALRVGRIRHAKRPLGGSGRGAAAPGLLTEAGVPTYTPGARRIRRAPRPDA